MTLRNHLKISFLMASAVLLLTGLEARSAVMTQTMVDAPISLRQTWLEQNMARNQRVWAQHVGGSHHAINAATANAMPLNLKQVWAAYHRHMRFASQHQPSPTTGFLPESRFVNSLWSRRAINAARFNANHVTIAQMMDWNTYFQGTPSPTVSPAARLPVKPSLQLVVPEPSSLMVAVSLIGLTACAQRMRRSLLKSA